MKKTRIFTLVGALMFFLSIKSMAAIWQWSAKVNTGGEVESRAYLWIPEDCKQVKTIVFAQHNMEEQSILENRNFRKEMGRLGVAEIWVSPAYDLVFNFEKGAGEVFDKILKDLADISGYRELTKVPFISLGHSWAASAPFAMAAYYPERALAALSVSGQWPYVKGAFAPDIWGSRNIDYIPTLVTMGEYEDAKNFANEGLKQKKLHTLIPLSMLCGPAQGHFNAAQEKIDFLSFYIKKAINYRLPKDAGQNGQWGLIAIDPSKQGWLTDRWGGDAVPRYRSASVKEYKGDKDESFWCFDRQTAARIEKYQSRYRLKKHQLIGFLQGGKLIEQRATHQQIDLAFTPEEDGQTFKLHTGFYDVVPGGSPRPANWSGLAAGSGIGHAKGIINIVPIAGPIRKINDSIFKVQPQLGYPATKRSYEAWFAAINSGDNDYRPSIQQAKMNIPPKNKSGIEQHILFDTTSKEIVKKKIIVLQAKTNSGLPVSFYIAEGPATITGNLLRFEKIPPSTRYPVKVRVIAYQYGRNQNPSVQTAQELEKVFWLKK